MKRPVLITEEFKRFWAAYPKRKSKGDAAKAWNEIAPPIETVLAALSWQVASWDWTKDGGQYVPYPATYLRSTGWEDEPTRSAPRAAGGKTANNVAVAQEFMRKRGIL